MDEISSSDKVTEHTIKKVKYHIKYNKDTTDSDVALIELNEPIEFRANARPVCLPAETESFIGHNATVVGWGKIREYGPSSRFLRRVDVEIIKTDECQKAYEPINVTKNMICAWHPKGGKDACQGDSGGPLMVKVCAYKNINFFSFFFQSGFTFEACCIRKKIYISIDFSLCDLAKLHFFL